MSGLRAGGAGEHGAGPRRPHLLAKMVKLDGRLSFVVVVAKGINGENDLADLQGERRVGVR